jgi:hypothetical protein
MQVLEFVVGYVALVVPFMVFFIRQGKELTWIKIHLKILLRKNRIEFDE